MILFRDGIVSTYNYDNDIKGIIMTQINQLIIIKTHYCSHDELIELREYVVSEKWDFREKRNPMGGKIISISPHNYLKEELLCLEVYLDENSWDWTYI